MFKLNESRVEIEIGSPSKLIAILEEFKRTTLSVRSNEKIPDETLVVVGGCTLTQDIYLELVWKPEFKDGKLINL